MNAYPYLFFDLDGTLTDPGEGITNAVMYALQKSGIPLPPREQLYPFIGPPLKDSFAQYYGLTGESNARAIADYREYFQAKGLFENAVYPGIPQLLARLQGQGRRLVLATSKPQAFAEKILEHFGLSPYFTHIAGASFDDSRSEKDQVIAYALGLCGRPDPADVLMIGDRRYDVEGARRNGLDCLGVLFGYGSREELTAAGAKYLADSVDGLGRLLLG